MSDIKLFRISNGQAQELQGQSVAIEKTLQILLERYLETLLGVRFLASEYVIQEGRIDTLGIDENGSPVIIEYKRATNENVINQGLFYLDWLMNHKADFELLVLRKLGQDVSDTIDWAIPRLLCIAGDFTRYDEHAVKQINRNIELIRYRRYGDELLLFELVNAVSAQTQVALGAGPANKPRGKPGYKTVTEYLEQSPADLRDLFEVIKAFLLALGDDVQLKAARDYFAFRRIKNFACVEVHPQARHILIFVKVDPTSITLEKGFTRDVRNIGHFGTGDLEITIHNADDFERAKPLLLKSYEAS